MKKIYFLAVLILLVSTVVFGGELKKIQCPSSLVTLEFNNVKLKKVEFVDDSYISYKVVNDSFKVNVKVNSDKVIFASKNPKIRAKISLYLPKSKTYETFIQKTQRCKFDNQKIEAEIGDEQRVIITKGVVKVLDEDNNQIVKVGKGGIYVNDKDELVKIDDNGIFIKSSDEDVKNYNGFWAKLLAKTISGFTSFVMDLSLKDIGKNVAKIINEQNLKSVAGHMDNLDIGVNLTNYHKEITKKFKIDKKTDLYIQNFNGNIVIKPSQSDSLIIKASIFAKKEKNLDKIKVDVKIKNHEIKIKSKKENQLINGGINLTINCPRNVLLQDINTSNGDITIKKSSGNLNAISSNGDIEIEDFNGNVKALTSNGNITARFISGEADLITSNGTIDANSIKKAVTARSSNGKINLKNISIVSDVHTSNSSIRIDAKNFMDNTEIVSSNGKITILLPTNLDLTLKAESSNGEITVNDIPFKNTYHGSTKFKGILGSGKIRLTVRTSNSDIILKKRK